MRDLITFPEHHVHGAEPVLIKKITTTSISTLLIFLASNASAGAIANAAIMAQNCENVALTYMDFYSIGGNDLNKPMALRLGKGSLLIREMEKHYPDYLLIAQDAFFSAIANVDYHTGDYDTRRWKKAANAGAHRAAELCKIEHLMSQN